VCRWLRAGAGTRLAGFTDKTRKRDGPSALAARILRRLSPAATGSARCSQPAGRTIRTRPPSALALSPAHRFATTPSPCFGSTGRRVRLRVDRDSAQKPRRERLGRVTTCGPLVVVTRVAQHALEPAAEPQRLDGLAQQQGACVRNQVLGAIPESRGTVGSGSNVVGAGPGVLARPARPKRFDERHARSRRSIHGRKRTCESKEENARTWNSLTAGLACSLLSS